MNFSKPENGTQIRVRQTAWIQKESTKFVEMGANGEYFWIEVFAARMAGRSERGGDWRG